MDDGDRGCGSDCGGCDDDGEGDGDEDDDGDSVNGDGVFDAWEYEWVFN